ncbi:D-3-phosphoglycerate dehydrogenase [Neorhizobium huautlense]|uniref:D-3-phosphoglycerate dehydrogenase n=1 Tax=Neorhizobium huautlense TaxID=67774 RepID=A0ABT9PRK3_9HYPH|nr:NAD(P)-dependent oxidoreductase [Neorhizobium huautlense]MDP9837085.1 D-3-phosphoglycerate dehydrogenase [Neorhizobium huautlense]
MQHSPRKCLIVQPIAETAVRLLEGRGLEVHTAVDTRLDTLRPFLAEAEVVITRNHGLSVDEIAAAPFLKVVGVHGTGTDKVHKPSLLARNIPLVNTPGANAQSVAELVIALILGCSRALLAADHASRTGNGNFRVTHPTFEISGRKLGLIGYGNISKLVARLALAFGMQVAASSRFTPETDLIREGILPMQDIDQLCEWADILSLHGVPEATPTIDARRLAMLGPQGLLINTARGPLIDERALADALNAGTIAGAGLDVLHHEPIEDGHPLLACPNLILTPHIGGSTQEALEKTGMQVATKVLAELDKLGDAQPA